MASAIPNTKAVDGTDEVENQELTLDANTTPDVNPEGKDINPVPNMDEIIKQKTDEAVAKAKIEADKIAQKAIADANKKAEEANKAKLKAEELLEEKRLSSLTAEERLADIAKKEKEANDKKIADEIAKADQKLKEVELRELKIRRKELAEESNLPKNLVKFVTGFDEAEISSSIAELQDAFKITGSAFEEAVKAGVEKALATSGYKPASSTNNAQTITLETFNSMSMREQAKLRNENYDLYKSLSDKKREARLNR